MAVLALSDNATEDAAASGEDPHCAGVGVVAEPTDDSGVAVIGQCDGPALCRSNSASADQLAALLGPDPAATGKKTHAAPACELSPGPPTMAVLPSADSATDMPCWALPAAPVPTNLLPC